MSTSTDDRLPMGKLERLRSFSRVLWQTVSTDQQFADRETIQKRFDVCSDCDFFDAKRAQCTICRCDVRHERGQRYLENMFNKLAHVASKCPIDKW